MQDAGSATVGSEGDASAATGRGGVWPGACDGDGQSGQSSTFGEPRDRFVTQAHPSHAVSRDRFAA
jgi:hypothetical protein